METDHSKRYCFMQITLHIFNPLRGIIELYKKIRLSRKGKSGHTISCGGIKGMKAIDQSPEHHLIKTLGDIKAAPEGWSVLYFALSKKFSVGRGLKDPLSYYKNITLFREQNKALLGEIVDMAEPLETGFIYLLTDGDIVILSKNKTQQADDILHAIYDFMARKVNDEKLCSLNRMEGSLYHYQKIANEKFLLDKRLQAFRQMTDENKVNSIAARRKQRDEPLILVVEDDRFTASYTANILNKEYDLIVCRNGEEAIAAYIEHAPDIVFLDIHLPGMNGHEVLNAIKAMDPDAYVIMLSVDTQQTNIRESAQTGAIGFIKKPFSKTRLLNSVKSSPFIKAIHSRNSGGGKETFLH